MNIDEAKRNMITQQVRTWQVADEAVLDLLQNTPRELFVPKSFEQLAYAECAIALEHNEVMLTPSIVGRLLQALKVQVTDKVLQIGTGSGYLTALLAQQAKQVYSIDVYDDFQQQAKTKLYQLEIDNVIFEVGDGSLGWKKHAPYDVIVITGSLVSLPQQFIDQLNDMGRIFVILGEAPSMQATVIHKTGEEQWQQQSLFETSVPALQNAPQSEKFEF